MAARKSSKTFKPAAKKAAPRKVPAASSAARARGKAIPTVKSTEATASRTGADVPSLFRINIEVANLDEAADFYGHLLAQPGRMQPGSRCYFSAGAVTLQVVDVSSAGKPHPAAKALCFTVNDLDAIYSRAKALGCLSRERVHGTPAGEISKRPWGERSFYAEDKWGNPLCFVEAGSIYAG